MLAFFYNYNLCYVKFYFPCWMFCTGTLVCFDVRTRCPLWLFCVYLDVVLTRNVAQTFSEWCRDTSVAPVFLVSLLFIHSTYYYYYYYYCYYYYCYYYWITCHRSTDSFYVTFVGLNKFHTVVVCVGLLVWFINSVGHVGCLCEVSAWYLTWLITSCHTER